MAQQTLINKLHFETTPNDVQLILFSSSLPKYKTFLLQSPKRLVIDFFNTHLEKPLDQPLDNNPLIYRLRSGIRNKTDLRIVADLKAEITYKASILDSNKETPVQLIIEMAVQNNTYSEDITKKAPFILSNDQSNTIETESSIQQLKSDPPTLSPSKNNYIDFDDPTNTDHQLTPSLSFGSSFELQFELESDYDLSSSNDDNFEEIKPSANIAFLYQPEKWFNAFLEFNLTHDYLINHPKQSQRKETVFGIKQAYLNFKDSVEGVSLKIGRQRHKDPREWWYDENLDAVRLFYGYQNFGVEFSASRKEIIGNDLLNEDAQEEINNYLVAAHYKFNKKNELNAYFLFRDDHSKRKRDPIYFGIQSVGKVTSSLKYWLDTAALYGSTRNKDFQAVAFDLGTTYAPKIRFKPSLTLGVAFGSGDHDRDNKDETFRQTDLEDNNGKFNGVTKFKYYGELLDPELSNIWILTAGLGLKPFHKSSIDFIYHYYRQHHPDDRFRSDLTIDPDGKDKDIGHELDIVLGYRGIKNLSTELIFGTFIPGKAFTKALDNAFFGKFEIAYRY